MKIPRKGFESQKRKNKCIKFLNGNESIKNKDDCIMGDTESWRPKRSNKLRKKLFPNDHHVLSKECPERINETLQLSVLEL